MSVSSIPNRIGNGTIWFRINYDVVAACIAEKLRRRMSPLPGECVRVVRARTEGSV